tara:strand:+ start:3790 stop:3969 length:180 start_codon:yes stop_codon:yes gene_type:complete
MHVHVTRDQLEVILRALDIFSIDMHSVVTVSGDKTAMLEAQIADTLMDELETYLEDPND